MTSELKRVRQLARTIARGEAARVELADEVRRLATVDGVAVHAIAEAAGMTRQRIWQLVNRTR